MRGRMLLPAVACVLFAQPLVSQVPAGSIVGLVADPNQNPLDQVEIRLINLSTAQSITTHTDLAGKFFFTRLRAGRYSLAVDLEGYAVQRMGPYDILPEIPVEIAVELRKLTAPLTRPKGGLEGMALEYGLVREQIEATPVILGSEGRTTIDKLLHLVPGVSPAASLEVDPFTGLAAPVSANGSRRSAINYQLDYASNNAQNRISGAQAGTFGPSPEGIETFRVVTHTYSARDGRNAGAVVAVTTRNGGADWHGQARAFWRPRRGDALEMFNGSTDRIGGRAAGGQFGGPIWKKRNLFAFADAEVWGTDREHTEISPVLTLAERAGDFSSAPERNLPRDPASFTLFPNGQVPAEAFDPLMAKYLDTFVPLPNEGENLHRSESRMAADGEMFLGRVDWRPGNWAIYWSYFNFQNRVVEPSFDPLSTPGLAVRRRQRAQNAQLSLSYTPTARLLNTIRVAGQRLTSNSRRGQPDFLDTSAESFGFDFVTYGADPPTLPDVTILDHDATEKLRVAPFLFSESSAQTGFQIRNDISYRLGNLVLRAGAMARRGIWPFSNAENPAGGFTFSSTAFRGSRNSGADLLMGIPALYQLTTPRGMNLRWHEFAAYGEAEWRPLRGLQITTGIRYEAQPPAVERLDRIAAFRRNVDTQAFEDTLPNLIFPGDPDGDFGPLPRSTVRSDGRHFVPRVGLAYSPTATSKAARLILGESGRSVFRASYGVFYDFGAFAGSSAATLFQATFPPFSTNTRFNFARLQRQGSFEAPLSIIPPVTAATIRSSRVSFPVLSFDPLFDNTLAHHWTFGWQRLLPHRVFLSVIYVGSRSLNLQRQRELNVFVRSPLLGFGQIRRMRLYSQYDNVRLFESMGNGRYNGLQWKVTRYLSDNTAFDVSYTWSNAFDNGSTVFRDSLVSEPWSHSDFDRRHLVSATWFYRLRLPRDTAEKVPWADGWQVSGIWRFHSGLPLDIRQAEDPTFSFVRVGRPDLVGEFQRLDPGRERTFTLSDGREVTGRFAFDPTAFEAVVPTNFDELRPGTLGRNAVRMHGFQQWDLRIGRQVATGETTSIDFGIDLLNAFNNRNWATPSTNVDASFFGIVRSEGLPRTFQLNVRFRF